MHATRSDLPRTLSWTAAGTDLLLLRLADFPDAELDGPSLLPDWTRRHVLAHLARNAEALGRLLSWAQTGVPTPMYADREQRQRDIDLSAANDAGQLRRELSETAEALRLHAAQLDEAQWAAG
ncbi:MAG TPA: maleylpyruvate isomerase N-terminal domain-containing protein, partial [Jatrophihabitantaceae bacterium]|nr:maleylpyruvate isomerase N-terminal domain-containing protein [Jatrophihabitantaceae bacterium]